MKDLSKAIGKTEYREFALERAEGSMDADKRTVELAFSSQTPVERWFGMEVLDHGQGAVDLGRMARGAALLVNHDSRDHVGKVESARIDSDGVGRAVVRFGKSARATEIWQDVQDGIRSLVSVGYVVHELVLDRKEGDIETYRATRWEPLEISIVSVPADASVGVGRQADPEPQPQKPQITVRKDTTPMEPTPTTPTAPTVDHGDAIKAERQRTAEITAIGDAFKMQAEARKAIADGVPLDQFRAAVLDAVKVRQTDTPPPAAVIGMSAKEIRQYSISRAVLASIDKDWSHAGLEREASEAADKIGTKNPRGAFRVPYDVLLDRGFAVQQRTNANVTTVGEGGYLVATDHLGGSFIELLRANTVAMQLCDVIPGLQGNVAIPKQTGGSTVYWVAEDSAITLSNATFGQLALSPKTLGALVATTRQLMLQSNPAIEQVLRNDIIANVGIGIDAAVFQGTGSTQPTGIANLGGGLNTVAFGGAPSWGKIVDMVTAVAVDKVPMVRPAYVGSPEFVGKCMQTERTSTNGMYLMNDRNTLNGYPFLQSSNITNTNLFFGSWNNALLGMWGGLDVLVDPYTYATTGTVRLVCFQSLDLGVRYDVAFCKSTGMTV